MIILDKTILSDDIRDEHFVCDLQKCKGACCVEGDLGAPLEEDELKEVEAIFPIVEAYLSEEGKKAIAEQGLYILDEEGDWSTPTIGNRECAYATYDQKGMLKCAFEQAYRDGKTGWLKPISCHMYPIRITKYEAYEALNYDRWSICADACSLGKSLQVPVYKFLKEPLIRKYGQDWYKELEREIDELKTHE
ncbi:MAG: DUF3109 family protein [Bacteroidetes bacterium]|nr:DUF3109 family protein [Bacteroidota bacterium]